MQILIYEYRNSNRLGRGYAKNQLSLHLLALQHLRKTYWSAEVQYTLFKSCMTILEKELGIPNDPLASLPETKVGDMGPPRQLSIRSEPSDLERVENESDLTTEINDTDWEDFKPFVGMPSYSDDLG